MDDFSYNFNDEEEKQAPTTYSARSSRIKNLIYTALALAVIFLLLPSVSRHCLPLLRPVGIALLQKLWEVLRFLMIGTAISFGIMKSQWKAIERSHAPKQDDGEYSIASYTNAKNLVEAPATEEVQLRKFQTVGTTAEIDAPQEALKSVKKGKTSGTDILCCTDLSLLTTPVSTEKHSRRFTACANEGLTALARSNSGSSSNTPIVHRRTAPSSLIDNIHNDKCHRRSSSLDCPIDRQQLQAKGLDANPEHSSTVERASSLSVNSVNTQSDTKVSATDGRMLVSSSRHSRSALTLDQFTTEPAKSARRNTSLSCDFGEEYSPAWLYDCPSPPEPSPAARILTNDVDETCPTTGASPKTTAKSITNAQNLVPWRSDPVDITASAKPSVAQRLVSATETASPISPGLGEFNRKADAFIAKFHERMRLQRLESFERYMRTLGRKY